MQYGLTYQQMCRPPDMVMKMLAACALSGTKWGGSSSFLQGNQHCAIAVGSLAEQINPLGLELDI